MKKAWLFCAFISGLPFIGCKDEKHPEPETTKPSISIVEQNKDFVSDTVCGSFEENVIYLNAGDTLELKLHFKGSLKLSQYKIEAHENFDCHDHEERPTGSPWELHKVADLSSKDTILTERLAVPADAATGNYHFNIHLLDVQGNEADYVEFPLVLE